MNPILWFICIGLILGWLAGQLVKGGGFGVPGNMVIGMTGAVIGGFLFNEHGATAGGGLFSSLTVATIGAVFLLYLMPQFRTV